MHRWALLSRVSVRVISLSVSVAQVLSHCWTCLMKETECMRIVGTLVPVTACGTSDLLSRLGSQPKCTNR